MRDITNNLHLKNVIPPVAARTDNTAIVGTVVDRKGYDALMFALSIGTNTDANATFAVLVEESDESGANFSAVADADLNGTEALAGYQFDDDTETRKIGYRGNKRYVRLTVTPTGNDSGNIFLAAVAVLGYPAVVPTANPPA
jgi:hypothetical protein